MSFLRRSSVSALSVLVLGVSFWAFADSEDATEAEASAAEVTAESTNPFPFTRDSVKRGRGVYLRYCQDCHDFDGKSMSNVEAEATDLTRPTIWRYGTRDGEVFKTIRDGGGDTMPPFGDQIKDARRIWEMVNFLRSIGPKDTRPEYVEEKED